MTIEELSKDSEFLAKIQSAKGADEVVALFRDKGFEVTEAQLKALITGEDSGELSESDMESVAGGIIRPLRPMTARDWLKAGKTLADAIRSTLKF